MNANSKIFLSIILNVVIIFGIFQLFIFIDSSLKEKLLEDKDAIQQEHEQPSAGEGSQSEIFPDLDQMKQQKIITEESTYFFIFLLLVSNIVLSIIIIRILRKEHANKIKEEKFQVIGELAAKLSHDIRNPLSIIKGIVDIMKSNSRKFDEDDQERIKMMDESVQRISHQVEDVMDFVRIKPLHLSNNSLLSCLESSLKNIQHNKEVKIVKPQNDVIFDFDKTQINIVFTNIISNAIQAIEENGEIKIRFVKKENHVLIEIEDSGPGVPEAMTTKIFEPLFTSKSQGTGLGLASCKNIVENHSGTISVRNNPSTFIIKIPAHF